MPASLKVLGSISGAMFFNDLQSDKFACDWHAFTPQRKINRFNGYVLLLSQTCS